MTYLKLTEKALYFVKGGSNQYIEKSTLKIHNEELNEQKVVLPPDWFERHDAPGRMVIEMPCEKPYCKEPSPLETSPVFARVISTNEWGATPCGESPCGDPHQIVDCDSIYETPNPQYIVVHHTAGYASGEDKEAAKEYARAIQRLHTCNNGWRDSGHNFLNTVNGYLLEGRHGSLDAAISGKCVNSAHAPGANDSPGIENEGNFQNNVMNEEQWNSLVELCVALCKKCQIDPDHIKGHRDFSATLCPGDNLYHKLPELRKQVRLRL